MSRRAVLAAVAAVALAATGCLNAKLDTSASGLPQCAPRPGQLPGGLVLIAQSVPSAEWLPCIRQVPVGWFFNAFDAHDGQTRILLGSDREGETAVTVLLRETCDVTGAQEVPSEWPELNRWERVTRVSTGYGGERHYTFTGGCVTYRFDLRGNSRAEAVATVTDALGFVSRASVARQLEAASHGQLHLD